MFFIDYVQNPKVKKVTFDEGSNDRNRVLLQNWRRMCIVFPRQMGLIFTDLLSRRSNSNTCSLKQLQSIDNKIDSKISPILQWDNKVKM